MNPTHMALTDVYPATMGLMRSGASCAERMLCPVALLTAMASTTSASLPVRAPRR